MQTTLKEKIGKMRGHVTVKTYVAGTVALATPYAMAAKNMRKLLEMNMHKGMREFLKRRIAENRKIVREILEHGYIRTAVSCENTIMDSPGYGLDIIIQRMVGINTYSLNILYGEIGTGSTTPAITDVALTTPTNRAVVAFQEDFGNTTAIVQFFFPDSVLSNVTYYEFGTFVDGTSTIGTGQLFNHALFATPYAKVAGQDTTIEVDFAV